MTPQDQVGIAIAFIVFMFIMWILIKKGMKNERTE